MDKVGFLIYGLIEFWPEENCLYSRKLGIKCKMFSTASRCFEHLLQYQGELVLQHSLFIAGWGPEYAKQVKPNTLYQNIMEIRRRLRQMGLDKPVIETIPRKGWRVLAEVQLEPLVSTSGLSATPSVSLLVPTESVDENNIVELPDSDKFVIFSTPGRVKKTLLLSLFAFASVLCIGIILTHQYLGHQSDGYFSEYENVNVDGRCKLFTQIPFFARHSYLDYQQYYGPRCNDDRSIYLTYNEQRVSVISCHTIKSGKKNCQTELYILRE